MFSSNLPPIFSPQTSLLSPPITPFHSQAFPHLLTKYTYCCLCVHWYRTTYLSTGPELTLVHQQRTRPGYKALSGTTTSHQSPGSLWKRLKDQREQSSAVKHLQDSAAVQVSSKQLWLHAQDLHKIKTAQIPAGMRSGSWSPTLRWEALGNWWLWRSTSVSFRDANPSNTLWEECHLHHLRPQAATGYGLLPLSDAMRGLNSQWFVDDYNFYCVYHCNWQANLINRIPWLMKRGHKLDISSRLAVLSINHSTQEGSRWPAARLSFSSSPRASSACGSRRVGGVYTAAHMQGVLYTPSVSLPPICRGRELTGAKGSDSGTLITPTATTPFQFCSSLSL